MDEDAGVRAPVTRLRRRLSVEQTEEGKSPAVNTPTMKRGGRRTAKSELELIDENIPDNTTKKSTTKKTATKDVTLPEEKPVTPARRSARVKSNTSIISETALAVNSPRAIRATRRASLAGSDGETPLTPVRQTRRTRKDSASSVEKEPQLPPKQGIKITDVIVEEPEVNLIKLTPQSEIATDQSSSPNSTRKSPRLLEKKYTSPHKATVETVEESSNAIPVAETTATIPTKNCSIILESISLSSQDTADEPTNKTGAPDGQQNKTPQNRLSIANTKFTKELSAEVTNQENLNKSWSDADDKKTTIKRQRTRSWTTLSASNDSQFYSDNESAKNKIKNSMTSPSLLLNKSGSGDGSSNRSLNQSVSNKSVSKREKKDSVNFVVESINEHSDKITIDNNIENKLENQTLSLYQNNTKNHDTKTSDLLEEEPSGDIKTVIYIEDSDSNSEKINEKTRHENEDQCVPVVEHTGKTSPIKVNLFTSVLDKNEQNIFNNNELTQRKDEPMDCEPMDIDETIPENIIIPEMETTELNTTGKKSTSVHLANLSNEEILNKFEKKSSITQSLDKSEIETKNTLIMSQIKGTSTEDINNAVKTPQDINDKLLSKSVDDLNITQENDIKKNLSLHYSTSTPLQDKNIKKFQGIHDNNSFTSTQNIEIKNINNELSNMSKGQYKNISKTEDSESLEAENLKEAIYTGNAKNKGKDKKSSKKETSIIQSETASASSKEEMETNKNALNENRSKVNDEDILTHKQQNESKLEDVSLDKKSIKLVPKIKHSKKNESSSEESVEEVESDDDAAEKSNLIDYEALDAGYDYESGDSQDESERQYQKDHEILDKGETLTTDEEFSDDSDYEKDSFIVSSNEEDEELLDGSDDDLSMSDKELKMTARSKKKYNERKGKEQREASREMFESRHKLNSSDKSTNSEPSNTKKSRRQQINSSESEEDIKPRKNNRLRLDSTKEASLLADKSEHKISIKKNKQLPDSDSSSDESLPNEREMTICNETIKESDPLLAQIKTEPKTPLRSVNSTIAFIDSEEVDNDRVDKNESTKTQSEFLDPLQATMVSDYDDDSLSSVDENIIQNYDSVLKDLNKSNKVQAKVCDISLNLDSKRKRKEKPAIVDELNLTEVKSDKPKNKQKKEPSTIVNEILPRKDDDEASSDSIDLHLLFSEDSNSSDTSSQQNKMKAAGTDSEEIIPLKRTEAKTDIRESQDVCDKSTNKSLVKTPNSEKKKKRQSEAPFEEQTENATNQSLNISKIKTPDSQKKKTDIKSLTDNPEVKIASKTSKKKHKKTASNSLVVDDKTPSISDNQEASIELETSKKKHKKTASNSNAVDDITPSISDNQEVSIELETSEKKTRKKPASNSFVADETPSIPVDNQEVPNKLDTNEKKKRKKSASNSFAVDETPSIPEIPQNIETSSKKRKRHSSLNTTKEEILPADVDTAKALNLNESVVAIKKKKRKIATQDEILTVAETVLIAEKHNEPCNKKQDKKSASNSQNSSTKIDETNKRKNKKRKEREDDETSSAKVLKVNIFDKVPRLPPTLLEKLEDVPHKEVPSKKPKLISTTQFHVQETKKRKNKPSNYLEESVYLNESSENRRNKKKHLEKPKVLPFVPTASTSCSGFTTNFKINVLPSDITFGAQSNTVTSFKDNYLYGRKIKKLGTYDLYRKQRNIKLSKF
ncbi:protein slender lobes isoform X2 [Maniola jurtina]|uniref:protein slender lobes isoform X2 n=1 Tax=Maniola jurtina TaxID=191418 RepID=UPI001E68F33A|nr:protein slender lobes isoform X2 [Maniola jurtina]